MASKTFTKKGKFKFRDYKNYGEYEEHQKDKLNKVGNMTEWLLKYDVVFRDVLNKRLIETKIDFKGKSVLCLAARIGTEVKSFIDQGAFALGIDLNPGNENKYVVTGDFHNLQFADNSVDFIFSNSFDHSLKPDKLVDEIGRVVKKRGRVILDIALTPPGSYECLDFESPSDLIDLFLEKGFNLLSKVEFDRGHNMLWHGEQVILEKK